MRFPVRALRISASTIAVVTLLRQQWLAAAAAAVGWLLILGLPRRWPQLADNPAEGPGQPPVP
ncbi:MAG: hypothetical protein ACKO0M_04390 [Cyanobium sp.]